MKKDWLEGNDDSNETDYSIDEYDISASPNDFNISTLFDFVEKGIINIPGFQRNYVWDIKRASKLIESIVIGVPIPQIFLYEEKRNNFLLIDGQQRLLTIYYFIKKRFPKKEKRVDIRKIFVETNNIPEQYIGNNRYFDDFNLQLPEQVPGKTNRLDGLNYATFDTGIRTTFELRTIRNIIIKQNFPKDDNSVMYEIFNRLNSGGVNLKPQEIRASLYHSELYKLLDKLNILDKWRDFIPQKDIDLNMRDVEILLRGFAMLIDHDNYKAPMNKFLNQFSYNVKYKIIELDINYLEKLFNNFIDICIPIGNSLFITKSKKFNISIFESIFFACCEDAYKTKNLDIKKLNNKKVEALKNDETFFNATQSNTASQANVTKRLERAKELLF